MTTTILQKDQLSSFLGGFPQTHLVLDRKVKRARVEMMTCPHCYNILEEKNDNVLGVNFDGSYYIKRAITIRSCQQCNYLQR